MGIPVAPTTSGLLSLPDELKLEIVKHLHQRRDLLHICMTCRTLEDVAMEKLYTNVQVEVPQTKTMRWNTGGLPLFRTDVVRSMRKFTIRNGCMDMRDPVYNRSQRSHAGSVDGYICDILERIPCDQLSSFSYLHKSAMKLQVLEMLSALHGRSLRELRLYELETFWKVSQSLPQNLAVLECRSIHEGEALGRIVQRNRLSLEGLRLGQESELVERYTQSRVGFLEQVSQPVDSFTSVMALHDVPKLQEIAFFGLDVSSFIPNSIPHALFFCGIKRLTLESCNGSVELLERMAETFRHTQRSDASSRRVPKLREFSFRHEAPSNRMRLALSQFLASFTGLEKLSLLLENATFLERCSTLINEHGPTLKTLVLECRIQPREHLGLDTSRPFGAGGYSWEESINEICRLCPNLVELGMGFPWSDEIVRIRKTSLPSLKQLRTIHIRNFPESQFLSQLGDYSVKEYAYKFVEWNFLPLVGVSRPALETLSLGPTLYESRWKSSTCRRQPPEFLRTHHFCLDWAKTRFERWSPMITGVSEECMEELRCESPLGGVFEQVWLR